jgi:hypothetical protein
MWSDTLLYALLAVIVVPALVVVIWLPILLVESRRARAIDGRADESETSAEPEAQSPDEPEATEVLVTEQARELIRRRGGRVFLWQHPFGRGYVTDKVGYHPPTDVEFRCLDDSDGISVWMDVEVPLPSVLEIRTGRDWLLRRRLRIRWEGLDWGARGAGLWGTAS